MLGLMLKGMMGMPILVKELKEELVIDDASIVK